MHVGDDVDCLQMERTMPPDAAPPIGQTDAQLSQRGSSPSQKTNERLHP